MFKTTIYLPEELHKKLRIWGIENNQSMGEVITMALEMSAFLMEKGEEAKKNLSPKQTLKIKEQAKLMTEDLKEFKQGLSKPRGEIHGEDYV